MPKRDYPSTGSLAEDYLSDEEMREGNPDENLQKYKRRKAKAEGRAYGGKRAKGYRDYKLEREEEKKAAKERAARLLEDM